MHYACFASRIEIIRLMHEKVDDYLFDILDNDGRTPFNLATGECRAFLIEYFRSYQPKPKPLGLFRQLYDLFCLF